MSPVSSKSTFIPADVLYAAIVDSSDDATRRRRAEFGRASGQIEPECDPSRSGRPGSHRSDVRGGIDRRVIAIGRWVTVSILPALFPDIASVRSRLRCAIVQIARERPDNFRRPPNPGRSRTRQTHFRPRALARPEKYFRYFPSQMRQSLSRPSFRSLAGVCSRRSG